MRIMIHRQNPRVGLSFILRKDGREWLSKLRTLDLRSDRGSTIVESLIAAVVIALALNALLMALSTGMVATNFNSERVTAEVAARSQIEYVKTLPYAASYSAATSLLPNASWQASITTTVVSIDLQKVQVAVSRNGSQLASLEGMKANR